MDKREEDLLNHVLFEAASLAAALERMAFDIRRMTWQYGSRFEKAKVVPMWGVISLARDVIHKLSWGYANLDQERLLSRELDLLLYRKEDYDEGQTTTP